MESLFVRKDPPRDGGTNMAIDVELLRAAEEEGRSTLRMYSFSEVCATIGRFQDEEEVAKEFFGMPLYRRPTGGGAVLHGHDQTVSIAVPLHVFGEDARSPKAIYCRLLGPFKATLEVGCRSTQVGDAWSTGRSPVDCFAQATPADLVGSSTDQKLGGTALRVTRKAVLLQASFPGEHTEASWLASDLIDRYSVREAQALDPASLGELVAREFQMLVTDDRLKADVIA